MKVIVQDLRSKAYLATDGRWVMEKPDAADFHSLLRAYHFARNSTSGTFQVLLYSPEDGYCAGIVTGVGIADLNTPTAPEPVAIKQLVARNNFSAQSHARFRLHFDQTNNHLN